MPSISYYRVFAGKAFEICDTFYKERLAALAAINTLAEKHGAKKDRFMSCDRWLEGFVFECHPPKHWKPSRQCQGYWVPNKKLKAGKEVVEEMNQIVIPTPEDLAKRIGCKMFFHDSDGQFVAAVGCTMRGGVFYLEMPTMAHPDWTVYGGGVESIQRGSYFTAVDQKETA